MSTISRKLNNISVTGQSDRGTSRKQKRSPEADQRKSDKQREWEPEDRAEKLVRDAERSKAKIFALPGNLQSVHVNQEYIRSLIIDEEYMKVGAHVDDVTYDKIVKGKYVNFSRLIPGDKLDNEEEDNKLQMFSKNGETWWAPPEKGVVISSFSKWEQAFRVFSSIYIKQFPLRAAELVEYNHVIHTISLTYIWSNVYQYDRDFRTLMGKNPARSWSMIFQHAWNLRL